ncbi:MAG: Asp-tRNA(Asn)/Glu-tRNA(Gln) amidotransferase subunit GatC [Alphaproteobacteria bacterium]
MPMDKETVRRVAHLARIRVADDELDAVASDLERILRFVEQLNEVDTAGVEPMTSAVALELRQRPDAVTDGNRRDAVLANAPDPERGFYTVPTVVE